MVPRMHALITELSIKEKKLYNRFWNNGRSEAETMFLTKPHTVAVFRAGLSGVSLLDHAKASREIVNVSLNIYANSIIKSTVNF